MTDHSQPSHNSDVWADGEAYEPYVGRWSRLVARDFVNWLSVAPDCAWLDVGCGTGALTQTVLSHGAPRAITGVDRSDGYVMYARAQVTDPRAEFKVSDAQSMAIIPSESVDAAVTGLVLNFIPQPALAVKEMARVVRPGSTVAGYVWDYAGKMELMRHFWDTAVALNPAAQDRDEGVRFPLCQPDRLTELFQSAGLTEVEVRPIDVPTVFRDFDDYWTPFLGGQAPAPGYCMSLSEANRLALRDAIRARLPTRPDGSIHLVARAWAVRGRRD